MCIANGECHRKTWLQFRSIFAQVLPFSFAWKNVISSFDSSKTIIFQVLASTIKNLLLFDIGLQVAFAGIANNSETVDTNLHWECHWFFSLFIGIAIPALTGLKNAHNQNETLSLTPSEASWLGEYSFRFSLDYDHFIPFSWMELQVAWDTFCSPSDVFCRDLSQVKLCPILRESSMHFSVGKNIEPRVCLPTNLLNGKLNMFLPQKKWPNRSMSFH